jgi:hypothetical protein
VSIGGYPNLKLAAVFLIIPAECSFLDFSTLALKVLAVDGLGLSAHSDQMLNES